MKQLLLPLALATLQGTPAEEPTPPALLDQLVRLTAERDFEAARGAGDALLARDLDDAWRGEVQHARGVSLALEGVFEEGADAFRSAAALAGPGALRDEALYGAGTSLLFRAEELFLEVPEVRERRGLPPLSDQGAGPAVPPGVPGLPVPPGAPPVDEDDAPDPLEVAREAYLAAKDRLLDRLRHGWRDVDTRANLELVQRRLRELDDIEREREEQEPPPPEQQPDPEQGEGDGEGEPQEDPPEQPPEQGEDPGEEPPETPPEGEQQAEPPPAPTPEPPAPEELAPLSPEQLERLYDALQEAEQEMRDLRRAMQSASAPRVEKDW